MTVSAIGDALRSAAQMLSGVSDTARLDAELLMAHALQISRSDLLVRQRDLPVPDGFSALLDRRLDHEPVAYIAGKQDFWDLTLQVTPDVLIPRADSETLIEAAIENFATQPPPRRILDLGTGSGALILAALSLFSAAQGTAIDASAKALDVARQNASKLGFAARVDMLELSWRSDGWAAGLLVDLDGRFDLILCNPPYVEADATLAPMVRDHEPHAALFAGEDGLEDYRILLPVLRQLLSKQGVAIFEIGYEQAEAVGVIASESNLQWQLRHDLAGNPRCLILKAE